MELPALPFHDLAERHPGLTPEVAANFRQAACVCLDRHHQSPIAFLIEVAGDATVCVVQWERADARTLGAWANETDTTRDGAYALALASVELTQGLVAMRRAEVLTGADYYIAPPEAADSQDMEDWLRLEISGNDKGDDNALRRRLREKVEQALAGRSNLPALAAVIGFRAKLALVATVERG